MARDINTFDKIDMLILFDLYDCAFYPGWSDKKNFVANDIFVSTNEDFNTHKNITGSFQWRVNKDGVILYSNPTAREEKEQK